MVENNPNNHFFPYLYTQIDDFMMTKTLILATSLMALNSVAQNNPQQPNIILFLVDDMGWQDTSVPFWKEKTALNNIYHTPAMEKLAARGVKFTQAYAASVSSPTRTSLMTGMTPAAHRVTNWTLEYDKSTDDKGYNKLRLPDWNVNGLQPQNGVNRSITATTLPQILQQNGYTTIHCGKAHWGSIGTAGADPQNLGFDVNIAGHAAGGLASYLGEQNFGNKTDGTPQRLNAVPGLEQYWGKDIFVTEALTIEAKKAMDAALKKDKPFYLYMSHYAIHIPLDKDSRFYQKYRDAGLKDGMARYASLIEGMDKSLGDIMEYLDEKGIAQNTIIIFMSDNGGLSIQSEREGIDNSHNYPLNSGKGSAYEGGVRVPMIIKTPYDTTARICNTPVNIIDFMPTILEMAKITKYKTEQKIEGISIIPLINSNMTTTPKRFQRSMYWHFPNKWGGTQTDVAQMGYGATSSILRNNWKLIYYYQDSRTELFNLNEDIFEIVNQAGNPSVHETRKKLADDLTRYLKRTHAQLPKMPDGTPCVYPNGKE